MRSNPWLPGIGLATLLGGLASSLAETASTPPATLLADVTVAAGIDFVETIGDDKMSNIIEATGVGCAFLDYDGDGWLDIYLVNGCWKEGLSDPELDLGRRKKRAAATDRLYRNQGDGTFKDVTIKAGVGKQGYGMGVVAADYDGDGDLDIYVTNYGPNFLFRNNGDGTFTEVAEAAGVSAPQFSVAAVFFDYNRDGRLDLYVGNYIEYDPDYKHYYAPDGFPGPQSFIGQQDKLYQGQADGTFVEVGKQAGIHIKPLGRAMGLAAFDYDNDGHTDVFVSNDAMENFLLRNKGDGTFENLALEMGVAFGTAGEATAAMAAEVGDYDGDGFVDLFVPDMKYSCLYHNGPKGFFDESLQSGIASASGQYHGWGGAFGDFNLDGHLDLYVSNGSVHHLEGHEDILFLGNGRGRFDDVSGAAGDWIRRKFVSRGAAAGDYDNDGDVDLLVASLNDRPVLLRNDTPRQGRHWLGVRLKGGTDNPDAIGATVKVKAGPLTLYRHRLSGGSYLSQHDHRLHFGLGTQERADLLEVTWPDGTKQTLEDINADRWLTVGQDSSGKPQPVR